MNTIKIPIPEKDLNEWRQLRKLLASFGLTDEIALDEIQGFVKQMIDNRTRV